MKYVVKIRQVFEEELQITAKSCNDAKRIAKSTLLFSRGLLEKGNVITTTFTVQRDESADNDRCLEMRFPSVSYSTLPQSTVSLMDEFETQNEDGSKKYRRLILTDFTTCYFKKENRFVWVDLIIERKEYGAITTGDVTMSQLKSRNSLDFDDFLEGYTRCQQIPANGTVRYFKVPYHLRAQTSFDRMPGGWQWGTKYGDTHDYVILGIRFESRSRL